MSGQQGLGKTREWYVGRWVNKKFSLSPHRLSQPVVAKRTSRCAGVQDIPTFCRETGSWKREGMTYWPMGELKILTLIFFEPRGLQLIRLSVKYSA